MDATVTIHRAPWIIPVTRPVLADGGIAVRQGRIVAVGPFADLRAGFSGSPVVDHEQQVLLPGLVNAHAHLELSHLSHLNQTRPAGFTTWVEALLAARMADGRSDEEILAAAADTLARMHADGVIAVADIGNTPVARSLQETFPGVLLHFTEYLGHGRAGLPAHLDRLAREESRTCCTAHAPYSVHAVLLRELKKRARRLGHIFPIHVAETAAEVEMVSTGRGELPAFLRRRGFWDGSFRPTGIDNTGSVQYLHDLGVLDDKTLCVHAVHVSEGEIGLLAAAGAGVCLCPGSNRFLAVGHPPLAGFLRHGLLPALGTDSLASNPELSLWQEMRLLARAHPRVAPADILAMATLGGARALHLDELGSLEEGRRADILAIALPTPPAHDDELYEFLVTAGRSIQPRWIGER